jgi:glycosyltransferase involved in cell wall biosynthesis
MKINWFSPLPPARTDIASYTKLLLPFLCEQAEVSLWTDQKEVDPDVAKHARIQRFSDLPDWPTLNRADITFYNMGNNYAFHGSTWRVSQKHPGIVILHDLCFHHFFETMYRSALMDEESYIELMQEAYGEQGRADALRFLAHPSKLINFMAERYPLTERIVSNAYGLLVHTTEARRALEKGGRWYIAQAPLPFPTKKRSHPPRIDTPPFNLIIFGYLGRNRRLPQFLEAFATFPEKEKFRLKIYGQVEEETTVRNQIEKLGLDSLVSLKGFVSEEELEAALDAAHLAINLRYPTMGEVSGSQLRIWDHALPSLVTRVGWYATIPETIVAHVDPQNEITDIHNHLRSFLRNPRHFAEMGLRGRAFLESAHRPEDYVKILFDLATEVTKSRAWFNAFKLASRVGAELSCITDLTLLDKIAEKAAQQIAEVFAGETCRSRRNRL